MLGPGQPASLHTRPFYPLYVRRQITPSNVVARNTNTFSDSRITGFLTDGLGVLLVGPPLDGKSRTLYETISHMAEWIVVTPYKDKATPSDDAFSLLKGKRVILLVEDLSDFVGAAVDLKEFVTKTWCHCDKWTVAATCRDGAELGAVREAVRTSLCRFYDEIPIKLRLQPLSIIEKETLFSSIGGRWNQTLDGLYPTPGSITMAQPLQAMSTRFEVLSPENKDVLRSIRLLAFAGVLPFTHQRVHILLDQVFGRKTATLGDHLDLLANQAFLKLPSSQDPIQPEPAYILGSVVYKEAKSEEDDFDTLMISLHSISDAEGLLLLGNTLGIEIQDHKRALTCFELAISTKPDYDRAWYNQGLACTHLKRYEDAITAFDQAIQLNSLFSEAWCNRGAALAKLNRIYEAEESLDKALKLVPTDPIAWSNKVFVLNHQDKHSQALYAAEQALNADVNYYQGWLNKGIALAQLDRLNNAQQALIRALEINRDDPNGWIVFGGILGSLNLYDEAIVAFEKGLKLDSSMTEVWVMKGQAHLTIGSIDEAIDSFEHSIAIDPDNFHALRLKGEALLRLGRNCEALQILEDVVTRSPADATAWGAKGLALAKLGRFEEAVSAYNQAIPISPNDYNTLDNKGLALAHLGRFEEAISAFDSAITAKPAYAEAWLNRGLVLLRMDRFVEALDAFRKCISFKPDDPRGYAGEGAALAALEKYDEALLALDTALKIRPEDQETILNKVIVLSQLGRNDEAAQVIINSTHTLDYAHQPTHPPEELRHLD